MYSSTTVCKNGSQMSKVNCDPCEYGSRVVMIAENKRCVQGPK